MNRLEVNGRVLHFECGHCEGEVDFGPDYWDFSLDDIIEGAVEINEEMLYWYIGGRMYETDKTIKNED